MKVCVFIASCLLFGFVQAEKKCLGDSINPDGTPIQVGKPLNNSKSKLAPLYATNAFT